MEQLNPKLARSIIWILRLTVVIQCIGNAGWLLSVQETPLLSYMWQDPELGGLGISEQTALQIQNYIGWGLCGAAVWVLLRPHAIILLLLLLYQLVITWSIVWIQDDFHITWEWMPQLVLDFFPFLSQSSRIAAPLALWLFETGLPRIPASWRRANAGETVLRFALAATFFAHGMEALLLYPKFVDMNILAARKILAVSLAESTAKIILAVIGVIDIQAALTISIMKWRWVVVYMACWGFLTALCRPIVHSWDWAWCEFATRAPHFGLPLALAVYWTMIGGLSQETGADNADSSSE